LYLWGIMPHVRGALARWRPNGSYGGACLLTAHPYPFGPVDCPPRLDQTPCVISEFYNSTDLPDILREAVSLIRFARSLTTFTGAGISVESGIPPFRGPGGLWGKYDPDTLQIEYFLHDPAHAWPTIKEILYDNFGKAQPNKAHQVLARLETEGWSRGGTERRSDAALDGLDSGRCRPASDCADSAGPDRGTEMAQAVGGHAVEATGGPVTTDSGGAGAASDGTVGAVEDRGRLEMVITQNIDNLHCKVVCIGTRCPVHKCFLSLCDIALTLDSLQSLRLLLPNPPLQYFFLISLYYWCFTF
jgi:hypothetical protein